MTTQITGQGTAFPGARPSAPAGDRAQRRVAASGAEYAQLLGMGRPRGRRPAGGLGNRRGQALWSGLGPEGLRDGMIAVADNVLVVSAPTHWKEKPGRGEPNLPRH